MEVEVTNKGIEGKEGTEGGAGGVGGEKRKEGEKEERRSKVVGMEGGKVKWEVELEGSISHIAFNEKCGLVLVTNYNTLRLLSILSGSLLSPPFLLPSPLYRLSFSSHSPFLLLLSTDSSLLLYNLSSSKKLLSSKISHLLPPKFNPLTCVKKLWVTRDALPVICLSNGTSFTHNTLLEVWMRVDDLQFTSSAFFSLSSHKLRIENQQNREVEDDPSLILSKIQFDSFMASGNVSTLFKLNQMQINPLQTLVHLEHQISSSLLLRSFMEYKNWSQLYVKKLVEESNENCERRLVTFCDSLLSSHDDDQDKRLKRELLESLLIFIKPLKLSQHYKQKLELSI